MPPKKSSNKKPALPADLWYHCKECDVHITYKEREPHEEVCPIPKDAPLEYIRNGIIYTTDVERRVFEVEELKTTPPKCLNNLLFMSEGAMRLAKFHIGQNVAVHTLERPDEPAIVRALWPLADKFLLTPYVTIEDYNLNWAHLKRFTIKIHALPNGDSVLPAKVLNVKIIPTAIPTEFDEFQYKSLEGVLKHEFKNTIYTLGSRLRLTFFNRPLLLTVCQWSNFDKRRLEDRFKNLNISKKNGEHFFKISAATRIEIENKTKRKKDDPTCDQVMKVRQMEVGGLTEETALITHSVKCALSNEGPKGAKISRGILLYGPPGCGKSMLCGLIAHKMDDDADVVVSINTSAIYSKFLGETEKNLAVYFEAAYARYPKRTLIIIEDINNLCPKHEPNEITKRVSIGFLSMLDTLNSKKEGEHTCIIATTSQIDTLSPSIRRLGRFDLEIEIGAPSPRGRREILDCLLLKVYNNLGDDDIKDIAQITHGYVGADLANLIYKAALKVLRSDELQPLPPPPIQELPQDPPRDAEHIWGELPGVEPEDMAEFWEAEPPGENVQFMQERPAEMRQNAVRAQMEGLAGMERIPQPLSKRAILDMLAYVKPSAMREVLIENPNVRWTDIAGQTELKLKLKQIIEWPLLYPDKFKKLGIKAPRGLLMYGPPGCSKTMIAKAIATESRLNFLSIKGPELFSMWVGESERAVRDVFRKARQVAPSVVFFDEIDAIGGERSGGSGGSGTSVNARVLTQLLTELDGVEALENVIVVAATNRPDMIDRALIRPGRIDRLVYVGLPDINTRHEIFRIQLGKMETVNNIDLFDLALRTERYSGAEIVAVCQEAGLKCLDSDFEADCMQQKHLDYALTQVLPRTNPKLLEIFEQFQL